MNTLLEKISPPVYYDYTFILTTSHINKKQKTCATFKWFRMMLFYCLNGGNLDLPFLAHLTTKSS